MLTCVFLLLHHNYPIICLSFCFFSWTFSVFSCEETHPVTAASLWQSPMKRQRSHSITWGRVSSLGALSQCSHSPRTRTCLLSLWRWSTEVRPPAWLPGVLPIKAADGFVSVTRLISWADMDVKPVCSRFVVFSKWKIMDKFWFSTWGDEIPSFTQNPFKTFREVFSRTQLCFKKLAENLEPSGG